MLKYPFTRSKAPIDVPTAESTSREVAAVENAHIAVAAEEIAAEETVPIETVPIETDQMATGGSFPTKAFPTEAFPTDVSPTDVSPTESTAARRVDGAHRVSRSEPDSPLPSKTPQEHVPPTDQSESTIFDRGEGRAPTQLAGDSLRAAGSPAVSGADLQQLESHAEQLAALLRQRQRSLDQREGELNACAGQWEQEARSARLEMDETRHRLASWHDDLAQRDRDYAQRARSLAAVELANEHAARELQQKLRQREDGLNARDADLLQREARLEKAERLAEVAVRKIDVARQELERRELVNSQRLAARQAELERREWQLLRNIDAHFEQASKALADAHRSAVLELELERSVAADRLAGPSADSPSRSDQSEVAVAQPASIAEEDLRVFRLLQELTERDLQSRDLMSQLERRREQLDAEQQSLSAERAGWMRDQARREKQSVARWAGHSEELARERARLETQSAQVMRLRALALEAQRDARRVHGESLEIRLAAEQLWNSASDKLDARLAARRFAELRSRIAAYFVDERHKTEAQARRLRVAARRLAQRGEQLREERERWRQQVQRQRAELEQGAC